MPKKCSQTDTESLRKVVIKVYPLHHCNDANPINRVKTRQFFLFFLFLIFTTIPHIPESILPVVYLALFF